MNKHRTIEYMPRWRGLVFATVVSAGATALGGCSFWGSEVKTEDGQVIIDPDDEGMYAYQGNDDLVRLDGDLEWEQETWADRNNLTPGSIFVVRDSALEEAAAPLQQIVGLRRVAWVRSQISDTDGITPVTGSQWRDAAVPELEVPLEYARSDPDSDVVQVRPLAPLQPGLYSFYMEAEESSRRARLGVAWPETDKQAYAATVCVDRYVGQSTGYRLCGEHTVAGSSGALQIYLVKPQTRTTASGRAMVISGIILNDSNEVQNVPGLLGELRDAAGAPLTRWHFKAGSTRLEPGQTTSFHNEITDVSAQVHSVNVNFDTAQASN